MDDATEACGSYHGVERDEEAGGDRAEGDAERERGDCQQRQQRGTAVEEVCEGGDDEQCRDDCGDALERVVMQRGELAVVPERDGQQDRREEERRDNQRRAQAAGQARGKREDRRDRQREDDHAALLDDVGQRGGRERRLRAHHVAYLKSKRTSGIVGVRSSRWKCTATT